MSTAGRSNENAPDVSGLAGTLAGAGFVRVLTRADGDALAAAGTLARALTSCDTPFQVSVAPTADERARRADAAAADDGETVVVGVAPGDAGHRIDATDVPTSVTAAAVARELGASPDPVLVLAGAVAAGAEPGASGTAPLLERAGLERRPGVAIPTADLADGLAHSTLVHAPFSGDDGAAGATLAELGLPAELDESAHRRVASVVAVDATTDATPRGARAVERFLHPYETPTSTFATLGGYADVLDVLAAAAPGTGVALALGHDVRAGALDAWRDAARRVHAALRSGHTGRYDGVFVLRGADAPLATTARLLRDYRSPEPVALVVGDGAAAAASVDAQNLFGAMREAASAVGGESDGTARRATARFDPDVDETEFVTAFREAL